VAIKLYCSLTSPYARKVRVVIHELDLAGEVEEIVTDPFNPTPEFLAVNPLARVPALLDDDGEALPDSRLIIDYLVHRRRGQLPSPPVRGRARWQWLRRSQLADGLIDAAVAIVLERRRPEPIIYPPFLDRQAAVIRRTLAELESQADAFDAEVPGIPEITLGVALCYLDFRLPYIEWRGTHPELVAWLSRFELRPSMQQTHPPPA
jgi:glutathione S-transferase